MGSATVAVLPPTIYNTGALVVTSLNVPCPFGLGAQVRASTALKHSGTYYRYAHSPAPLRCEMGCGSWFSVLSRRSA